MTADARPQVRVVIVDDHQMFADSLARLLGDDPEIAVMATASSVADGLAAVERHDPDVVLLDHHLPDGTGLDAIAAIGAERPWVRMVMLTGALDDEVLVAAIDAGCSGFLTKDHAAEEVIRAVRAAAAGEVLVPPALLARLLPRRAPQARRVGDDLTPREMEVLQRLVAGAATKAIAADLHLSVNTVRNHVQQVLVKLGAHSKLEAVATAVREGVVRRPGL